MVTDGTPLVNEVLDVVALLGDLGEIDEGTPEDVPTEAALQAAASPQLPRAAPPTQPQTAAPLPAWVVGTKVKDARGTVPVSSD